MNEKYSITYSCGCVHEIENNQGVHQPTGVEKNCDKHKEGE